jgi:hypothetical protein
MDTYSVFTEHPITGERFAKPKIVTSPQTRLVRWDGPSVLWVTDNPDSFVHIGEQENLLLYIDTGERFRKMLAITRTDWLRLAQKAGSELPGPIIRQPPPTKEQRDQALVQRGLELAARHIESRLHWTLAEGIAADIRALVITLDDKG